MYIIIITSLAVAKFAYCDMQAQQNYCNTDNVMNRMGAQVHGLGANNPTCTPLATPLIIIITPRDHLHAQMAQHTEAIQS